MKAVIVIIMFLQSIAKSWIEAGTLNDSPSKPGSNYWLPTIGVGYRFEFKPRMNIQLDFGIGRNSTSFYFQVGEAF